VGRFWEKIGTTKVVEKKRTLFSKKAIKIFGKWKLVPTFVPETPYKAYHNHLVLYFPAHFD
jgi:hypothetical protein